MVVIKSKIKARLFIQICLAFLFLLIGVSCSKKSTVINNADIVLWENSKAISLQIDKAEIDISIIEEVYISLHTSTAKTAILGDFIEKESFLVFSPLIPLTPGLKYDINQGKSLLKTITIPLPPTAEAPILTTIYPSNDSVPENLLKMYFKFSKPMQEVRSLDFIKVINTSTDSLVDVFLDLQPELWNKERTQLTLWLDPGRIKRDLIPNKERGLPIIQNNTYELTVSNSWKDVSGIPLIKAFSKKLIVGKRDNESPVIETWKVEVPAKNTNESLKILFNESMDGVLAKEVIEIYSRNNTVIKGVFFITENEKTLVFTPNKLWREGQYYMLVDAKFEDLAGNNLNRLFDTDLHKEVTLSQDSIQKRNFVIE